MYPQLVWQIDQADKEIYLTFDDGPIPEVTSFILDQLNEFGAKASFFCVGHNIEKHPQEFNQLLNKGHTVGNHTFNHIVGWNSENEYYLENVGKCQIAIEKHTGKQINRLFRPPHGRIKRAQIKQLNKEYGIIMWTYLTGDFDSELKPENCLSKAKEKTSTGDIVIFHDSLKAYKTLKYVLPEFLRYFSELGFQFKPLN